ncbi:hypothetical protein [Sphingopyxis terrae]|uniref:hypothetical protein n=1 Tax=Sphingopyxis terrae TaxID=33052 RepID=UPI003F7EDDC9
MTKQLYRIVDFFELLQTLRTGKLRVPSAARFSDPNELLGLLFAELAHPVFSPLTEEAVDLAVNGLGRLRECHYVSCWTQARDSVAMWEIYSPQKSAAQLEVSEECLRQIFNDHYEASSFAKARGSEPEEDQTYFYPPTIGPCAYEDLYQLYETMQRRTRLRQKKAEQAAEDGTFEEVFGEILRESSEESQQLFHVKDAAYAYENEVRFCLKAMRRNERPFGECAQDRGSLLFDTHLRPTYIRETGDNIFVDFPSTSIQHVWLDGRAPKWLLDEQQALLNEHKISSTRSRAYGSLVDNQPMKLWRE